LLDSSERFFDLLAFDKHGAGPTSTPCARRVKATRGATARFDKQRFLFLASRSRQVEERGAGDKELRASAPCCRAHHMIEPRCRTASHT